VAIGSAAEARGGFGLLAVTLADSGLKLWVVPRVALSIAAIEPEGGAYARAGAHRVQGTEIVVQHDRPEDPSSSARGSCARGAVGCKLTLGGLGRDDGIHSCRASATGGTALALRPEIPSGNPVG